MKTFIALTALAFLSTCVVTATEEDDVFQDPQETIAKRGAVRKDILSTISCRYLKTNGFLTKNPKLKNLCLTTFHCNDLLSKKSCKVIKARNECKKDKKLSLTYCPFTCNKCGVGQQCTKSQPLGMQSKAIPDAKITASTSYSTAYRPSQARLHMHSYGWTPKTQKLAVGSWLQVDLRRVHTVNAVATQGSKLASAEWTKSYSLQYSFDGSTFKNYQSGKVFKGNTDKNTVVKHVLKPLIRARFIRILPKTWNRWPAIRMELYGCK